MFNTTNHQGNANQNHSEMTFYSCYNGSYWKDKRQKCWQGWEEKESLVYCWWECILAQPLWKTVQSFFIKLKLEITCDPAIPLLGINPKEIKSWSPRDIFTIMFIAALFVIAKIWNDLSVHQWMSRWRR